MLDVSFINDCVYLEKKGKKSKKTTAEVVKATYNFCHCKQVGIFNRPIIKQATTAITSDN